MPRLQSFVLAGMTIAIALAGSAPATAGRQVHGGDVARILTGKNFHIECVDGTRGRGQFGAQGVVNVLYRRSSAPKSAPEESDRAVVRVKGVEICLAWKQFGGGGDGCYPVVEQAVGTYRLGSDLIWCEIRASGAN